MTVPETFNGHRVYLKYLSDSDDETPIRVFLDIQSHLHSYFGWTEIDKQSVISIIFQTFTIFDVDTIERQVLNDSNKSPKDKLVELFSYIQSRNQNYPNTFVRFLELLVNLEGLEQFSERIRNRIFLRFHGRVEILPHSDGSLIEVISESISLEEPTRRSEETFVTPSLEETPDLPILNGTPIPSALKEVSRLLPCKTGRAMYVISLVALILVLSGLSALIVGYQHSSSAEANLTYANITEPTQPTVYITSPPATEVTEKPSTNSLTTTTNTRVPQSTATNIEPKDDTSFNCKHCDPFDKFGFSDSGELIEH